MTLLHMTFQLSKNQLVVRSGGKGYCVTVNELNYRLTFLNKM